MLPDDVDTTAPFLAAPRIGDVVIRSPFLKFLELLTAPEILRSLFCFQPFKTGILSCGAALDEAASLANFCAGFPNKVNVPELFLAGFLAAIL